METWRKNVYITSIAEFFVIMGFGFLTPLIPLFIQKVGNFTTHEAAFWTGIALGGGGIAMFLSSPLWGILADRMGRKPMMVRAQFGLVITFFLLAFSPNVYWIIGIRIMQGLLGGTVPAASALVAASVPRDKLSFAMGILIAALYAGNTVGPLLGGMAASTFGFKTSFYIGGILLFLSGLAVLFLVQEKFHRPPKEQRVTLSSMLRLAVSKEIMPLLLICVAINLAPQIVYPTVPLLLQELAGGREVLREAGLAFALIGLTTVISALAAGIIEKRVSLKLILVISCIGSGLLLLPPIWANTVVLIVVLVGVTGFLTGPLLTSTNAMFSLLSPSSQQGIVYGLSQSAGSLGAGFGPLIGGVLTQHLGLQDLFFVPAGLFVTIGIIVFWLLARRT